MSRVEEGVVDDEEREKEERDRLTTMRASELARTEVLNCLACLPTNRLNMMSGSLMSDVVRAKTNQSSNRL